MGLSRMNKKCRECNKVDRCSNKRMEALAYIGEWENLSNEIPVITEVNITIQPTINVKELTNEIVKSLNRERMRGRY